MPENLLEPGERIVTIDPSPVLRDVTLDVAEAGLRYLGLELDELLEGGAKPEPCAMSDAKAFCAAVLENADEIDLGKLPLNVARAALEVVEANFYFDCLMSCAGLEMVVSD